MQDLEIPSIDPDIAFVRVGVFHNPMIPLHKSVAPTEGMRVFTAGYPHPHGGSGGLTVAEGKVVESGTFSFLADFEVKDGASGSPVLSENCELVGILSGTKETQEGKIVTTALTAEALLILYRPLLDQLLDQPPINLSTFDPDSEIPWGLLLNRVKAVSKPSDRQTGG